MSDGHDRARQNLARQAQCPEEAGDVTGVAAIGHVPDTWLPRNRPHPTESGSWQVFWESASEKHRIVQAEARDYVDRLSNTVRLHTGLRVLDFGCGTGHVAETLAHHVREVSLWDSAHAVRVRTAARVGHLSNISLLDLSEKAAPSTYGPYDLILSHSVVQYMTSQELIRWLRTWKTMLAPEGSIILSDLVTASQSTVQELIDLLLFAARCGVLLDALREEAASLRRYLRARVGTPLLVLSPDQLRELTAGEGLRLEFLPENLGHKKGRLAVSISRPES